MNRTRRPRQRMTRRVLSGVAALPFTAMFVSLAVAASSASWTDIEWVRGGAAETGAPITSLDCELEVGDDAIGTSRGQGRVLGGHLLGLDLDTLAEVSGVEVLHDGNGPLALPESADVVPGTNGEGFADPLDITALSLLNLPLTGLLKLPLGTEVGVVDQYARSSGDASSAAAAGVITDSGAIDLEQFDDEETPGDERARLGELQLGELLSTVLGDSLGNLVSGLADLKLDIGAVAASASLDGCGAAWSGDIYDHLSRDYAIAGLDLDVESGLVGGLVTAVAATLNGVENTVNGLSGDEGLVDGLVDGLLEILDGVLGGVLLGETVLELSVTVDLSAARALLDDTISDDAEIVVIDLASGVIAIDLEGLLGQVYGTDGLNGLPPNTELLINDVALSILEDALTDALAAWVADIIDAVQDALNVVNVHAKLLIPLELTVYDLTLQPHTASIGQLGLEVNAGIGSLLDGSASVEILPLLSNSILCAIPIVGPLVLCPLVNTAITGLLNGLTGDLLATVAVTIGTAVKGALDTLGGSLSGLLDTALDAPVAAVLALLNNLLGFLFDEDDGVLSILVNAQNAPDPDDPRGTPGPEPSDWAGLAGPGAGPAFSTGRYDIDALRISVLGGLDPLTVALDVTRASVGDNVLTG